MSEGAQGAQGLEPAEDAVSLSALSEDDLTHIANNPQYRAMLQDLLSPYMGESSVSTEPADTLDSGRGTDPTRHQSEGATAPDQRLARLGSSAETTARETLRRISEALKRSTEEVNLPTAKRQRLCDSDSDVYSETSTTLPTFDPSLDKEDKEEFRFEAPDQVTAYLEKHFRRSLSKEERTAMLRKHPKPDTKAMAPPRLDQFITDFAPKKVDKARDAALARIQGGLLYAANPLAYLWANLMEQGLEGDSEAVIPVSEVLDVLQRTLVLLGNASNLLSERRREIALEAIHPSLKKYAKGDFTQAGTDLFGGKFKEELVQKVEADGALSKAVRIVSRGSKVYQNPQSHNRGKNPLFHSRTSGYGAVFGRRYNPYRADGTTQGKGKHVPGRPYQRKGSVFERLGQQTDRSAASQNSDIHN